MTNAADVLLVGGPANGRMVCCNKVPKMPASYDAFIDYETFVTYPVNKWWNAQTQRWYWLAIYPDAAMSDAEIANEILAREFQPAWDMRDLPAPGGTTHEESST